MALQDLTPQLRTRLSRVERVVGLFVAIATAALLAGFAYYLYHTASRKGWFLTDVEYSTSLQNAVGLKVGDPVKLMGFNVGEITKVEANEPGAWLNVTVFFEIRDPYYGYIWTDSGVRVAAADFLGNRVLEMQKGYDGIPTVLIKDKKAVGILNQTRVKEALAERTTRLLEAGLKQNPGLVDTNAILVAATNEVWKTIRGSGDQFYTPIAQYKRDSGLYWVTPHETPAVTERLEQVVAIVENALPNILGLTNRLSATLNSATGVTHRLEMVLADLQPVITNLAVITSNLRQPQGSFGEWLIPTNTHSELNATLATTRSFIGSTDTNLTKVVGGLDATLVNLANITSNLNSQVQANTNVLRNLSEAVVHADQLMQGLKGHWLLRSAFKTNRVESRQPRESRSRDSRTLVPPKQRR